MSKSYNGRITKWVWDGKVILHEWVEHFDDVNDEEEIPDNLQSEEAIAAFLQAQLDGRPSNGPPEYGELPSPTTWLFDPDTFAPASKIVGDKHYSIITDHLGTPLSMYDEMGVQTWAAELDVYGTVKNLQGERNDCPFRYPGQYEDGETGLYYNRFRYYDAEIGGYVSQDPISLLSKSFNFYSYVHDCNAWIDIFGLSEWIDLNLLNFSQAYVEGQTETYEKLMKDGDWDWNKFPDTHQTPNALRVVEVDGQLVSLDNRRLLAAQNAKLKEVPIKKSKTRRYNARRRDIW